MKTNYELRYACDPRDAKCYDTTRLRGDFLIEKIFTDNEVNMVYSMYDRLIVGGAKPVGETLILEAIDPLKATHFLSRRELGIFNVGGPGRVKAGDAIFDLNYKEALYLGAGERTVTFESIDPKNPAKFYFNSAPAHKTYPDKKVTKADAVVAEMGSLEGSNHRNINKMLVSQVLETCQLQMGMTELQPGSVWDTRCQHILIAVVWKRISILRFQKVKLYATLWENLLRLVIYGCKENKLYYLLNGQYTQLQQLVIILLYGAWVVKI